MFQVQGKWALITGASRGVGYQIAIFMASQGCNLVLHSRSVENTKQLIHDVKALGIEAYAVEAELSDLAAVDRMLNEIEAKARGLFFAGH